MEHNTYFSYHYSAAENREVQEIRNRYLPPEENKLDELKRLDRRVQISGLPESLTVGVLAFLLFATGVCLAAQIIGQSVLLGLLLVFVGAVGMLAAYPLYRRIFQATKARLTPRILQLSAELSSGATDTN